MAGTWVLACPGQGVDIIQRKIDTGALSHFYTGCHEQSPVMMLSYSLKEAVDAERLQAATVRAVNAFPVFRVKLALNEKRQPVYEENECAPRVYADDGKPHAFGRESDGYLFRISCGGSRIRLSIHHMLTDFTGAHAFLVFLLRCYLHQTDEGIDDSESTIPLDPRDFRDPYELYGDIRAAEHDPPDRWENELVIPSDMQYRRYERYQHRTLLFPAERVLHAAKKTDSSILPMLFWLLSNAAARTYQAEDLVLTAGSAVNCRRMFGSRTPLNFSRSFAMYFLPRERCMDLETQLTVQRAKMDLQLDASAISRKIADRREAMKQKDGPIEAYVTDREALERKREREGRKTAFYVSYPGRADLPADLASYVESFYFNSPTTRGAIKANAYSWGPNMVIHINEQMCKKTIAPAMKEILRQNGVESSLSEPVETSYDYYPMEELISCG